MVFTTLTDAQKEFYRLQRLYWQQAVRCKDAKAYLAGCVMLGSALETLLILMINCYPAEADRTGKVPTTKGKPKPLLKWTFIELLRVAKAAQWLPAALNLEDAWSTKKALVGDYAEVVRMIRNLAHPARYAEDHYRHRVTERLLQRQFDMVFLCRDWLVHHNNKALIEHMKSQGIM